VSTSEAQTELPTADLRESSASEVSPEAKIEQEPSHKEISKDVIAEFLPEPPPIDAQESTPTERPNISEIIAEHPAELPPFDGGEVGPELAPESIPESPPEVIPEPFGPIPTIKITSPKHKDIVRDAIEITTETSIESHGKIDRVELWIDGTLHNQNTREPYIFLIYKGHLDDGQHVLKVMAISSGHQRAMDEIEITTVGKGPQITFIKPKNEDSITGSFDIEVEVKSALGLEENGVILRIDGQNFAWQQTTPNYQANFDPQNKPFDSIYLEVQATDKYGISQRIHIVVIFDPPPGTKLEGEACDDSDPTKRCIANHSCLAVGSLSSLCYKHCIVGKTQCSNANGYQYLCQPSHMGTTRGACVKGPPLPGSLYSKCGTNIANCQAGLICVGANTGTSYCLPTCTPGSLRPCKENGFDCFPLTSGGGACIELCGQACTSDLSCTSGQICSQGKCSGPYCSRYGSCIAVQTATGNFDVCI
jgi:hypothetical protein